MTFGEKITYARKQKKMTQSDLGKAVGTSGDIIGKYEREEIKPSIETASRIADALGVTLDYLVKDSQYQNVDKDALNRLKLIEKLPKEERSHLFATMDAFFAKHKLQTLMQS
jgi:transcriptional regulator with XRE-family HTH domain